MIQINIINWTHNASRFLTSTFFASSSGEGYYDPSTSGHPHDFIFHQVNGTNWEKHSDYYVIALRTDAYLNETFGLVNRQGRVKTYSTKEYPTLYVKVARAINRDGTPSRLWGNELEPASPGEKWYQNGRAFRKVVARSIPAADDRRDHYQRRFDGLCVQRLWETREPQPCAVAGNCGNRDWNYRRAGGGSRGRNVSYSAPRAQPLSSARKAGDESSAGQGDAVCFLIIIEICLLEYFGIYQGNIQSPSAKIRASPESTALQQAQLALHANHGKKMRKSPPRLWGDATQDLSRFLSVEADVC